MINSRSPFFNALTLHFSYAPPATTADNYREQIRSIEKPFLFFFRSRNKEKEKSRRVGRKWNERGSRQLCCKIGRHAIPWPSEIRLRRLQWSESISRYDLRRRREKEGARSAIVWPTHRGALYANAERHAAISRLSPDRHVPFLPRWSKKILSFVQGNEKMCTYRCGKGKRLIEAGWARKIAIRALVCNDSFVKRIWKENNRLFAVKYAS